jgi:hypothetical protein
LLHEDRAARSQTAAAIASGRIASASADTAAAGGVSTLAAAAAEATIAAAGDYGSAARAAATASKTSIARGTWRRQVERADAGKRREISGPYARVAAIA